MPHISRDKIIQAALKLFSDEGYRGTTTKRIAEEAGVNESTIFRIFESKDSLFRELLTKNNQLIQIIDILKNSSVETDIEKQLIKIANLYQEMYRNNPDVAKILYRCAIAKEELNFINKIIGENAYSYLVEYFNTMVSSKKIQLKMSSKEVAFYFLSMVHGAFQREMLFCELDDGINMATLIDIILHGVLIKENK